MIIGSMYNSDSHLTLDKIYIYVIILIKVMFSFFFLSRVAHLFLILAFLSNMVVESNNVRKINSMFVESLMNYPGNITCD